MGVPKSCKQLKAKASRSRPWSRHMHVAATHAASGDSPATSAACGPTDQPLLQAGSACQQALLSSTRLRASPLRTAICVRVLGFGQDLQASQVFTASGVS
jgi:hypothetical protein